MSADSRNVFSSAIASGEKAAFACAARKSEIAARVGYDNPAYFSTLFKKYTGMTISQYRKAFQNGY